MKQMLFALMMACLGCHENIKHDNEKCAEMEVRFSPNGGATNLIVNNIKQANKNIKVMAFSFTSIPIAEALVEAKKRIDVQVVLDPENLYNKNSVINQLYSGGIAILIDKNHAIAHNKIIIIDDSKVSTGSLNFSKGAEERNAENSIMISDRRIADLYVENFNLHREHSQPYTPYY